MYKVVKQRFASQLLKVIKINKTGFGIKRFRTYILPISKEMTHSSALTIC